MERFFSPEVRPLTLTVLGLFGLVMITLIGLVLRRAQGDAVSQRLNEVAGRSSGGSDSATAANARQALDRLDKVVVQSKQGGNTARDLARADMKLTVAEFYLVKAGVALLGAVIGAFVGRASPAAMFASGLIAAVLFSFLPNFYVNYRSKRRLVGFNNLLGDTITMMANALRGGYSFLQTLDMVSKEAPYPVNDEFRRVVQEVGLGRTTEEALGNLQRRLPSEDLDLLITAVNIQMEVGGNLAQILDTIGHTIRERVRIKGEINTLTAQGRISAWVITGLPVGLAIFISVVNPEYMAPIFSFGMPPENWCCLPVASIVMIVMGFFAIMKIMDIEV